MCLFSRPVEIRHSAAYRADPESFHAISPTFTTLASNQDHDEE